MEIPNSPSFEFFQRAVAESAAPLVIITGSGISHSAGFPTWSELRIKMQDACDEYMHSMRQIEQSFDHNLYTSLSELDDYWQFFSLSKKFLGSVTFREVIKRELGKSNIELPHSYRKLLELSPKGLVTLNLDRLANIAMAEAYPGTPVPQIFGTEIARKWGIISGENPWSVYLHGTVDDVQTWVLDAEERDKLLSSEGHKHFLSRLYLDHTVLLVGVSADDIALSTRLIELTGGGFDIRRVFWLTSRTDEATRASADQLGIQVIQYQAKVDADHSNAISSLVNQTLGFRSFDESKPDPRLTGSSITHVEATSVKAPSEIAVMPPQEARFELNYALQVRIKDKIGDDLYNAFTEFAKEYHYPIRTRAFYVHNDSDYKFFFDYVLKFPELGSGNFGTVYQAEKADGAAVAVKIMHDNIVDNPEMLGGFRRGSRSMEILTQNKIDGVAGYIESYEMPPSIIMEFINGNSLSELYSQLSNFSWIEKLRMIYDISNIVDKCHKLPQIVLHRDIKPSNLMLTGLDYVTYKYEKLTVLDFDMSWHKGSSEKDVVFESRDDFGYLAPEQTDVSKLSRTRSTKVDSYGLGMTAYSIFGGRHPIANSPLDPRWCAMVRSACNSQFDQPWISLRERLVRLIVESTEFEQTERLNFDRIRSRLKTMCRIAFDAAVVAPIDIAAEEILARVSDGAQYRWDDITDSGEALFPNGARFSIAARLDTSNIKVQVSYDSSGLGKFEKTKGILGQSKKFFDELVTKLEGRMHSSTIGAGKMFVEFTIEVPCALPDVENVSGYISEGLNKIRSL